MIVTYDNLKANLIDGREKLEASIIAPLKVFQLKKLTSFRVKTKIF